MENGRFIAYYRVSTKRQGRSGLGLEAQTATVAEHVIRERGKVLASFTEIESGKRSENRPQLAEALSLCRVMNATLIIAKLDRLARDVAFISKLMKSSDVTFVACDLAGADKTTIHVLAAVAEREAEAISARTKAALAAAKARGTHLGGMRTNSNTIHVEGVKASAESRHLKAISKAKDLLPIIRIFQREGAATLRDIAAKLNEKGIPTARGGAWSAVQVQRILHRAQA